MLSAQGMYVTLFDNGLLHLVMLPYYGTMLISLALLPKLAPLRTSFRVGIFLVGVAAVVLGGTRSGLMMAIIKQGHIHPQCREHTRHRDASSQHQRHQNNCQNKRKNPNPVNHLC